MRWIPRMAGPEAKDLRRMRELDDGLAALARVTDAVALPTPRKPAAH